MLRSFTSNLVRLLSLSRFLSVTLLLSAFALLSVACSSANPTAEFRVPDGGIDVDAADVGACDSGARVCGDVCCGTGEVCSATTECCPRASLCGDVCCGAGQVCEGAVCHQDCSGAARCQNATDGEFCCGAGEVCAQDACFLPTQSCTDFYDCPARQYCEPTLAQCLPAPGGEECIAVPTGGEVKPTLLWHWQPTASDFPESSRVMVTPIVANLTDDNEDGAVNHFDMPDVVFTSSTGTAWNGPGVLRIVSGDTGLKVLTISSPQMDPESPVAIGDIDNDGFPEIVGCAYNSLAMAGDVVAFSHTGTLKWRTTDPRVKCGGAGVSIADLDGDGHPEVFVRYTVINGEDGSVDWSHECVNAPTNMTRANSPCDYSTAANLDADPELEVVGGNIAYNADGTVYYDRTADLTDGFPAVADLDLDGLPEIVGVASGFTDRNVYSGDHFIYVLDHEGNTLWGPSDVHQGHAPALDTSRGEIAGGGPPTIANFDEDPEPEIALATGYGYAIFESDGSPKWYAPTLDASSRKTGSSVFDFDGDGVAEAVYSDEYWLRVFDGRTGDVRYCECNTTGTLFEYPVIADVNNDGHAEIIVASNTLLGDSCPTDRDLDECTMARIADGETAGTDGVRLFGGPLRDWVRSRRIWNQHAYHVTNVTEDGTIPVHEEANWTTPGLNNFRSNVQPGAGNAPDLVLTDLGVDISACPTTMVFNVRVRNDGWSGSLPGVPVTAYVELTPGNFRRIGRMPLTRVLLPGESEVLAFPYNVSMRLPSETIHFRAVINDVMDGADASLHECRDTNNEADVNGSCSVLF